MIKMIKASLLIGLLGVFLSGCVPMQNYVWRGDTTYSSVDNEYFNADITPSQCYSYGCEAFTLSIDNKTNENLEVDWNKTLYIVSGQTSGGFMFGGIVYKDRNNIKPPDIVFPGSRFSKSIWPNNLVEFHGKWSNYPMPPGVNGIFLTVLVNGKEINEKLTMVLFKKPI